MIEIHLHLDGKTIATIIHEQCQDVRALLREQREKDRDRAMKLSMVYDQIAREENKRHE